jgi:hypothetical protein
MKESSGGAPPDCGTAFSIVSRRSDVIFHLPIQQTSFFFDFAELNLVSRYLETPVVPHFAPPTILVFSGWVFRTSQWNATKEREKSTGQGKREDFRQPKPTAVLLVHICAGLFKLELFSPVSFRNLKKEKKNGDSQSHRGL